MNCYYSWLSLAFYEIYSTHAGICTIISVMAIFHCSINIFFLFSIAGFIVLTAPPSVQESVGYFNVCVEITDVDSTTFSIRVNISVTGKLISIPPYVHTLGNSKSNLSKPAIKTIYTLYIIVIVWHLLG